MEPLPQSPKRQAKHSMDVQQMGFLSKAMFTLVHLVMSAFFVLCAYVNLNDPDPLLWVFLYLTSSAISFLAFLNVAFNVRTLPSYLPSTLGTLSLVAVLVYAKSIAEKYSFQSVSLKGNVWEFFETEEGREIGGLVMIFFAMCIVQTTLASLTPKGGRLPSSFFSQALAVFGIAGVGYAIYATIYLQPQMNERLKVEHCSGSL